VLHALSCVMLDRCSEASAVYLATVCVRKIWERESGKFLAAVQCYKERLGREVRRDGDLGGKEESRKIEKEVASLPQKN
jgi:hypothetical protein